MKIAIAGYGVEGKASYAYWNTPDNQLTIVDRNEISPEDVPKGAEAIHGEDAFSQLYGFDMVVRSPSLPPATIKTDGKIWSATNEFFAKCPAPIIGVTGTKGKGTTASMIEALFRADGRKTWLVGNIGLAALTVLSDIQPGDCVIFELSSFQLWDLERSPQTAVVLLIEADHLNVHGTMEVYAEAKARIAMHQATDDFCVYHPTNQISHDIAMRSRAATKLRYATRDDGGVYVNNGSFCVQDTVLFSTESLHVKGDHNKDNACAAITVGMLHGLSNDVMERGIQNFKGLPYRLEYIRTVGGVAYYNDSFSSAPAATIAAIHSFDEPEILILGGIDKGADFQELAEELAVSNNIKEIVLIGEVRQKLASELRKYGVSVPLTILNVSTMQEIIQCVSSGANEGDVVILSPACASFDMFENFYDRGRQFTEVVKLL